MLKNMIPYGRQDVNDADIDAVISILKSDFLTQGPTVPAFEKAVADYCGAQYAVATNSATSALHIACLALGVSKGDIVWTSPITFVASSNCALYCGAAVDFVDINPDTYNMSADFLSEKLAIAEKNQTLPKVVIPVHMCGQSCEMEAIYALSKQYGFRIIEDASHAIGGKYQGIPIGSGRYSDITIFSFHPVKIITSGEGGMAVTNNSDLDKRLRLLRSHGITSNVEDMLEQPVEEIWSYQQIGLGFNYRLTDIQAALGLSQMQRLDQFVTKRQSLAHRYDQLLSNLPLITPWQHPEAYSSYHLYPIILRLDEIKKSQRQVLENLRALGIIANLHYIPVYRQPYYQNMGFRVGYCPNAEQYFSRVMTIPLYTGLSKDQQDQVALAIQEALG
jgi:UDP-4-amino-4,6-dideoxy-N-acetyl-beta-L-altrosamine transaminase